MKEYKGIFIMFLLSALFLIAGISTESSGAITALAARKDTITCQNNSLLLIKTIVGVVIIMPVALYLYVKHIRENNNNSPRKYSDASVTIRRDRSGQ